MRPVLALALGAAFTTLVVGCTLLVSFDDPPPGATADDDDDIGTSSGKKPNASSSSGSSSSSSSSSGDTSSSSSSSSSSSGAAVTWPPTCDKTQAELDKANCGGKGDGFYCGIANGDDLTQCEGGNPVCIFHCQTGCAVVGNEAVPDQCAKCDKPDVDDVWQCGKDTQWTGAARDYAYQCKSGKLVGTPANCGINMCHTICTRTNPPPLPGSCCQNTVE